MLQPVVPGNCEHRVLAENRALDAGCNRRGHNDPRQHGLIQISNDFLNCKGDGCDGSIESRCNSGRSPDRK